MFNRGRVPSGLIVGGAAAFLIVAALVIRRGGGPTTESPTLLPATADLLGAVPPSGGIKLPPKGKAVILGPLDAVILCVQTHNLGERKLETTVRDDKGRKLDSSSPQYDPASIRSNGGIVEIHILKGYPPETRSLEVVTSAAGRVVGTWRYLDPPHEKGILPPSQTSTEAQIVEVPKKTQTTWVQFRLRFRAAPPDPEGAIVKVLRSNSAVYGPKFSPSIVSSNGAKESNGLIDLPNSEFVRQVEVEIQRYGVEAKSEMVTFTHARLADIFGQPTLLGDPEETRSTPSGLQVRIARDQSAPLRKPRKILPQAKLRVEIYCKGMKDQGMQLQLAPYATQPVPPEVTADLVEPTPSALGLQQIEPNPIAYALPMGTASIAVPKRRPSLGKAGAFKFGPIPKLTLKITTYRARSGPKHRAVLEVVHPPPSEHSP